MRSLKSTSAKSDVLSGTADRFVVASLSEIGIRLCDVIFLIPSCSSDFDDFAPTPTPPERRQGPVGTARASRPALLGKQKDLRSNDE